MIPRHPRLFCIYFTALLALFSAPIRAEVRLHNLFTDHMVLQRDTRVPVWGWANEGEKVTVEFRGKKASTVARHGKWMIRLDNLKAGGPGDLTVTGANRLTVKDVLVGEVWIASGQSNMEWPMQSSFEPAADIAGANEPKLRLFTVPKLKAEAPVDNVKASWQLTSPEPVKGFSAVGYYFGRSLQKSLGVPVGIIHTSWGGSPAEVWMREEILAADPDYRRDILDVYPGQLKQYQTNLAAWEKEEAAAKAANQEFKKWKPWPAWKPSELYNGMIAPLLPFAIQGAIWYQGESNAGRAQEYRRLFADMIRNWRKDWGQGDFTFLAVQLAPFNPVKEQPDDSSWAELREAQVLATKILPKVGVAVITDYGNPTDIHPTWKKPAGERLALAARAIAYHEKLVYSGPQYRRMTVEGDAAILTFDQVGRGLVAGAPQEERGSPIWEIVKARQAGNPQALVGFAVAGEDRKFVWAKAEIRGKKIAVSSPSVPKPVAVRYGWADCPVVNLFNAEGLPASPFRTDDWPMVTAPKSIAAKK
jgi:sialate O-acetylesterase